MHIFSVIRDLLRRLPAAAALALCLHPAAPAAPAAEALVVKDAPLRPYEEAIKGFRSTCGCTVRELDLGDPGALEKEIRQQPAAVVAVGSRALRKVKRVTEVPVIYMLAMPSEAAAATAENISGVSMDIAPQAYLDAMAGLFPQATRIGVLSDPAHTGPFVREAAAAARAKGVTLVVKKLTDPREAPALLDELRGKVDLLWMLPDATFVTPETVNYLMLFSFQNRLPVFTFSEKYVELGAVAALTIAPSDMGAQAGEMARTLAAGGGGPLRAYARNARLVVNAKVGAKLGARINEDLARTAKNVE